jgi:hypothetical protein
LEIEPRYVDVAIRRWQAFTGRDALHAETGLTFEAMTDSRRVVACVPRRTTPAQYQIITVYSSAASEKWPMPVRCHVRFGSLADMCGANGHVRFAPNSDRKSGPPQNVMSALPPKADMCGALAHVRFGPKADMRFIRSPRRRGREATSGLRGRASWRS